MSSGDVGNVDALVKRVRESAARGSVLLLEGDTDVGFFTGLLGDQCPEAVSADGRLNALAVAALVPGEELLDAKVLTIVDADFDRVSMRGALLDFHDAIHVVFTDAHDLETTIISIEEVRRRVLTTVLRCSHLDSISVWSRALAYQIELSLVRLLVHQQDWGVRVEGIPPAVIDDEDGRPNRGKLVAELFPRFRAQAIDVQPGELMVLLRRLDAMRSEWPQLVNGHELCRSIAVYARQLVGRNVSGSAIEEALRVSCQIKHLKTMDMARCIRLWWETKGVPAFF
jgi:Protein of unknown function (DUF4435)